MNRGIATMAGGLILLSFAFITFPLWALGHEEFDFFQEFGILLLPFGLVVMLIAGISENPLATTVGGTFGNPEFDARGAPTPSAAPRPALGYNPREPVHCPTCRTMMASDLVQCPRCAQARPCRSCGRPLGLVLERATCPLCARPEPFCNCPALPRKGLAAASVARSRARRV